MKAWTMKKRFQIFAFKVICRSSYSNVTHYIPLIFVVKFVDESVEKFVYLMSVSLSNPKPLNNDRTFSITRCSLGT